MNGRLTAGDSKQPLPAEPVSQNITWHPVAFTRAEREVALRQKGFTVWFTGLSASGKSTLASALEQHLVHHGLHAYCLDGDNIRFGLNRDLAFGRRDRVENIRRIAEVAKLFADAATICITSFISPYRADREAARRLHEEAGIPFLEAFVDCPLDVAELRDPKGLYKKARKGEIPEFTGISAPYEAPLRAELTIRTDTMSIEDGTWMVLKYLKSRGLLQPAQC